MFKNGPTSHSFPLKNGSPQELSTFARYQCDLVKKVITFFEVAFDGPIFEANIPFKSAKKEATFESADFDLNHHSDMRFNEH